MKYTTFVSGPAADAPVAYALAQLGARPFYRSVIVLGALMGMISSLLVFQYGPVSYTHLDVYKRQEQNYRSTQNILQAASAVVANNIKRKGKNLWTSRQGGAKIGYYEAVSYTHLDVYKRQFLPLRLILFATTAEAACRIFCVER